MTYKTEAERREEAPSKGELALEEASRKAYDNRWWETQDNVVITGYWMAENGWSASEMALLIEKPWKYSDEFVQAEAANEEASR